MSLFKNILLALFSFLFGFFGIYTANFVRAHGGDAGLIHSCVNNSSGTIKIVGPNDTCGTNEASLDWNPNGGTSQTRGFYRRTNSITCDSLPTEPDCPTTGPLIVECDPGDVATGGSGYLTKTLSESPNNPYPISGEPVPPTGWMAPIKFGIPREGVTVQVICADLTP